MPYIISTGWWCDGTGIHAGSVNNKSSNFTRSPAFFDIWIEQVLKVSKPQKILITDSKSPVDYPRKITKNGLVEFVSLNQNFGHAINCEGKYCGWTRSILNGAFYSYINDCDFVYVEQDCLLFGEGIIEKAFESMDRRKLREEVVIYVY